jgi:hypothetical protein
MQEVPFDCKVDCDQPVPWLLIFLLCAGAVGLVFLGRTLRNKNKPLSWVCYAFAALVLLVVVAWILF